MPDFRFTLVGEHLDRITLGDQPIEWRPGRSIDVPALRGSLQVESVVERPGITAKELVLSVTISFATGVPASLVANWIWENMRSQGDNAIVIEHEGGAKEPESPKELERFLPRVADRPRRPSDKVQEE